MSIQDELKNTIKSKQSWTDEKHLKWLQSDIPKSIADQDQMMVLDDGLFLLKQIEQLESALREACNHIDHIGAQLRSLRKEECESGKNSPEYWIRKSKK